MNDTATTATTSVVERPPPRRVLVGVIAAGYVMAAAVTTFAVAAGFGVTPQNVDLDGRAQLGVTVLFSVVLAAGVVMVRTGLAPPLVATMVAAVVVAVSLPTTWPVRVTVWVAGVIVARVVERRRWTWASVRAVVVVASVVAVTVTATASWAWGQSLQRDPLDAPPAPLWLAGVITPVEGVVTINDNERCMVRMAPTLFVDPGRPDVVVTLGDAPQRFIVRACS